MFYVKYKSFLGKGHVQMLQR